MTRSKTNSLYVKALKLEKKQLTQLIKNHQKEGKILDETLKVVNERIEDAKNL